MFAWKGGLCLKYSGGTDHNHLWITHENALVLVVTVDTFCGLHYTQPDSIAHHHCSPLKTTDRFAQRTMMRRLLHFGLIILLAPLLYAFTREGVLYLVSVVTFDSITWFLLGVALAFPISLMLLNNSLAFIEHLIHELEHAVIAFLFTFRLPGRMEIDPEEGSEVRVTRGGGCLVALAPYYFPMLTVPLLLLKVVAALAFSLLKMSFPTLLAAAFDFLIGATLMFHYLSSIKEFRFSQDDIRETGYIPSIVGVFFLSLLFLLLSVTVVVGSYSEFLGYLETAFAATVEAYRAAFEFLSTLLLPWRGELIEELVSLLCENCTPTPGP